MRMRVSVNTSGKEEVLDQGHNLDLAEVHEELLVLILWGAVQDQVRSEHEDRRGEDRQYLETLEAQDSIPEVINLVDFEVSHESVENPGESGL